MPVNWPYPRSLGFVALGVLLGHQLRDCVRKTPAWMYMACLMPPGAVLAAVYAQPYVNPVWLLVDAAAVAAWFGVPDHTPIYYGFVSNLGALIWSAAASIAIFAGLLLLKQSGDRANGLFLLASGIFTVMLLIDDFFMFHELVFPYVTGLDEKFVVVVYASLLLLGLYSFRKIIIAQHVALLVIALTAFGTSALIDAIDQDTNALFVEDAAKFVGIWSWLMFYFSTTWNLLSSRMRN